MKPVTLKHKNGRVVSYKSSVEFCKKEGLKFPTHISDIKNGKRYFYQGWYNPEPTHSITILDDDDNHLFVDCIPEFIVWSGISIQAANAILFEGAHVRGFRKKGVDKIKKFTSPKYEYILVSPNNKEHKTKSIAKLARKYNLCRWSLYDLIRRKTRIMDNYRGWKFKGVKEII